jgi:CHAT domain-containing protein
MSEAPAAGPEGDRFLRPGLGSAEWVDRLLKAGRPPAQLLEGSSQQELRGCLEGLCDAATRSVLEDVTEAERLARAATILAEATGDAYERARAMRATSNVRFAQGRYAEALRCSEEAELLFESIGDDFEVARTRSSALQLLMYQGRYEECQRKATLARRIFERLEDRTRLARLDTNEANLAYRRDRYEEALSLYERALAQFREAGEARDVAVTLTNMALCCISLNRFAEALRHHEAAQEISERNGFGLLKAEADYNIAYLYYLRGQYTRAIELYRQARRRAADLGAHEYEALCDLDLAELYLELNLVSEGMELAQRAYLGFEDLGRGYEASKALTNLAIAAGREGESFRALQLFEKARGMFLAEGNTLWPAEIDAYRAVVMFGDGRYFEARRFAEAALGVFDASSLASKAALCRLLLAHVHLQFGELVTARRRCLEAIGALEALDVPALEYRAYLLLGQVEETLANDKAAFAAYLGAHGRLERMRSHLEQDELRIGFLKDKLVVYESLVWMTLAGKRSAGSLESALGYIEQAKSRSLTDLMAFRAQLLPSRRRGGRRLASRIQTLREELNWFYRKIDQAELGGGDDGASHVDALRRQSREREAQLLRALRELHSDDQELASLQDAATIPLSDIRGSLPEDGVLLEYYAMRGTIVVAVLSREELEIVPLAPASQIRRSLGLLRFQLDKFRYPPEIVQAMGASLREAAEHHLEELYRDLVAPVRARLRGRRLIVVPHDFLHYVPFHALGEGGRALVDDFAVSYAPSASVHHLCAVRPPGAAGGALVMGVPDEGTPFIREEVERVALALPGARLFVGAEAEEARLRELGAGSRYVHIATHGLFRYDNPMFSSLQLGSSRLSLFDLYQLELGADLVTLSGCGTGLNVPQGGDELIGLTRGLLYAGARSALVSLWDVNDRSTATFMECFYGRLRESGDKAEALRGAMLETRASEGHPYYWAPFVLVGRSR